MPIKFIIRPLPSELDNEKVESLMKTLEVKSTYQNRFSCSVYFFNRTPSYFYMISIKVVKDKLDNPVFSGPKHEAKCPSD